MTQGAFCSVSRDNLHRLIRHRTLGNTGSGNQYGTFVSDAVVSSIYSFHSPVDCYNLFLTDIPDHITFDKYIFFKNMKLKILITEDNFSAQRHHVSTGRGFKPKQVF